MSLIVGVGDFGLNEILTKSQETLDRAEEVLAEINDSEGAFQGDLANVIAEQQQAKTAIGKRVIEVADLTALSTMNGTTDGKAIHVQDLDRGGFFKYEPSGYTPNGGTVVAASGGGAFVRQYDNVVNVKWFGAKGDGTGNDYAAFAAAINWLKNSRSVSGVGQLSGTIFVPRGVYPLSDRLVIPDKVRLLGEGSRITELRLTDGFADSNDQTNTGAVFVELSNKNYGGKKNTFSNGLEHVSLNLMGKVGLTGCYSEEINEQSGLRNFLIANVNHIGIRIRATTEFAGVGPQNFYIEKGEIIFNNTETSGSRGIQMDINGATFQALRDISVVGKNATARGIDISSAAGWASSSIHFENLAQGFFLADRGPVIAFSIQGVNVQNTCPTTIYIRGAIADSYGYHVAGIRAASGGLALQDYRNQPANMTNLPGPLGYYAVGREPYSGGLVSRSVVSSSTVHERRQIRSEDGEPTVNDIAEGQQLMWRNKLTNKIKLYVNDQGTIKATPEFYPLP